MASPETPSRRPQPEVLSQGGSGGFLGHSVPRRLVAGCLVAAAVATLLAVDFGRRGANPPSHIATAPPTSGPSPTPTTTAPSVAAFRGVPIPRHSGLNLILQGAGAPLAVLALDTGRLSPITALPRWRGEVQLERLAGGWGALLTSAPLCDGCPSAAGQVYFLPDGTLRATPVASAQSIALGSSGRTLWLTTYASQRSARTVYALARELTLPRGEYLRPKVVLPNGFTVLRGVRTGLLVTTRDRTQIGKFAIWNPGSRAIAFRFYQVVAATEDVVVWVDRTCRPDSGQRCVLHFTDVTTHHTTVLQLLAGFYPGTGIFGADGRYLALISAGSPSVPSTIDNSASDVVILDTVTNHYTPLIGTDLVPFVPVDAVWYGDHLVLAAVGPERTTQFAVWRPGQSELWVKRVVLPLGMTLAAPGRL